MPAPVNNASVLDTSDSPVLAPAAVQFATLVGITGSLSAADFSAV